MFNFCAKFPSKFTVSADYKHPTALQTPTNSHSELELDMVVAAYNNFPSCTASSVFGQLQIILLGDEDTQCEQFAQSHAETYNILQFNVRHDIHSFREKRGIFGFFCALCTTLRSYTGKNEDYR